MRAPDDEGRPLGKGGPVYSTTATGGPAMIVDARDARRARQVYWLAVIEAVELAYGPAARLEPTPAGPRSCPAWCPWCATRWPSDCWAAA